MQVPELPALEVVSFVTSNEDNQSQEETTVGVPWCPTYFCDTDFDCTQTACSSSDWNGGVSCTDECHATAAGC